MPSKWTLWWFLSFGFAILALLYTFGWIVVVGDSDGVDDARFCYIMMLLNYILHKLEVKDE